MYCKCFHIDLKCQESWAHARTPHTPLTCLPLVAVMAVFCCVVLRDVALAEAARTSSRKKVVPLPTAVTCSISLSLLHVDPNSVSGREVSFIEHPLTPLHSGRPAKGIGMLLVILSVVSSPVGSTSAHYCMVCSLVFGVFIHSKVRMGSPITVCSPPLSTWGSALIHVCDILCKFYRHQCT